MKTVIDTCVLYPTVMREMVLGAAEVGLFEPIWSDRILEEWARAARKLGPTGEAQARAEIALVTAAFPKACRSVNAGIAARLWLSDPNDIHVLATAVTTSADAIMTLNAKDFPRQTLAEEGLARIDPDRFLYDICCQHPDEMEPVAARVLTKARRLSGQDWTLRALLKKARLPRCAKMLAAGASGTA